MLVAIVVGVGKKQELESLTSQLRSELDAKQQELQELSDASSQLLSQDLQAAKVIELSKKNRTLNLSLEREKQKVAKLQQALALGAGSGHGSGANGKAADPGARAAIDSATDAAATAQKDAAQLKERLLQTTNRMGQLEHKVAMLEAERVKMVRALTREVGDDVPLAKLLEEGSDWKGRREQVIALKDKIKQLKEQLGQPVENKHEAAARTVIGTLSKERTQEALRMKQELAAAKEEAEALRGKMDAAVSRRRNVEAELASLKEKLAVVLNKTANDDKLVAALQAELAAAKGASAGAAPAAAASGAAGEVQQLRQHCAQLEDQLDKQQKVIKYLQQQQQQQGGADSGVAGLGTAASGQLLLDPDVSVASQTIKLKEDNDRLQQLVAVLEGKLQQLRAGAS